MLEADITQAINEGKIGFVGRNLTNGKYLSANEGVLFGTASVIKIAIALGIFCKAERGDLDIHQERAVDPDDIFDVGLDDCGVLKFFAPDSTISAYNACALMLSVSDNTATNFLLRIMPLEEINACLSDFGFGDTRLTLGHLSTRQLYEPGNTLGVSTPNETVRLLQGIAEYEFLQKKEALMLLRMMSAQHLNTKIPRLLPSIRNVPSHAASVMDIYAKGGEISSSLINADAAVIQMRDGTTLIISIYSQGITDAGQPWKTAACEHVSTKMIARLGLQVFEELIS